METKQTCKRIRPFSGTVTVHGAMSYTPADLRHCGTRAAPYASMPHWLESLLTHYGYVALFIGVFLENLGIPVPGETVLLAAGFFAHQRLLRIGIVIPCAAIAAMLGDNFGYWIGRKGGRGFVERHGRWIGLTPSRIDSIKRYFDRHGPKTIFFARFISGVRVFAAIFAGISRFPWPMFVAYNAAGAVVWSVAIGLLGYAFGKSWRMLEHWVGRGGLVLALLVVVGAAVTIAVRHHRAAAR